MRKIVLLFLILGFSFYGFAQTQDLEQLRLDLEKLVQMKAMLNNLSNGYSTIANGYNQITNLSKGNFDLHKNYLDQLLQVAPQIKTYPVVQTILDKQAALLTESSIAYNGYLKSGLFSATELFTMKSQLDGFKIIMSKKLDQLNLVLTPGALRMSDQERLVAIDRIDKDVGDALNSERAFVKEQSATLAARGQRKKDINGMRAWYGFKQ